MDFLDLFIGNETKELLNKEQLKEISDDIKFNMNNTTDELKNHHTSIFTKEYSNFKEKLLNETKQSIDKYVNEINIKMSFQFMELNKVFHKFDEAINNIQCKEDYHENKRKKAEENKIPSQNISVLLGSRIEQVKCDKQQSIAKENNTNVWQQKASLRNNSKIDIQKVNKNEPVQNNVQNQNKNPVNSNNKKQLNIPNTKNIELNGVHRIVNDSWITSNGSKRHNKKSNKGMTIGTAISEIKSLQAISRPYVYYVGQFSMKTNADILKSYISKFAKVISIEELSTHISSRYFRSFKVTVESYSSSEILKSENWPGGVKVSRWWQRNDKTDRNTKKNLPVANIDLETHISKDVVAEKISMINTSVKSNQSIIPNYFLNKNDQMIELNAQTTTRGNFFNSIKMINQTSKQTEASDKNVDEMDQDIHVENSIVDCLVNAQSISINSQKQSTFGSSKCFEKQASAIGEDILDVN